jgi:hypothetical protein
LSPPANYLLGSFRRQGVGNPQDDRRDEKDFYKKPGGGLIDPQGEPKRDDEITEPAEELPPEGLGKKSPDQDLDRKPRHRGG